MKCEEVRDDMIAYLKCELDEEGRNEIDEHLARCLGCRRELEMSQKVLSQTQAANEASIVETANSIIEDAAKSSASDIHIDPTAEGADVRFRIDGVLQTVRQIAPATRDALVARIKSMSEMSISDSRSPQDGRFMIRIDNTDYDLRVTTMPFVLGEKITIRVLSRAQPMIGFDKMGFLPEQLVLLRKLINSPCGIVLFSGPMGSGKTTTMYSAIKEIQRPGLSIVTIEEPVELLIKGVQQAQINYKEGITIPTALRSFMRQDADVIMVAEFSDVESMELSVSLAIGGHLVLSQVHAETAASVPKRLVAYGLKPFLLGESLIGIVSQRLIRRICNDCREDYTPSEEALQWLGLGDAAENFKFQHGKGCDKCRNTGYRGRTSIHEVLVVDDALSKMISMGETDPNTILAHVKARGFISLMEVARKKVLEGFSDVEEVCRVASGISDM